MNHGLHMMTSLTLYVHCQGHPVGRLEFEPKANAFSFSYDPAWEKQPDSFVLSPHISFEAQADSLVVKRFLENLLPEGRALDIVAHTHQVSKNNVYALTHELGKEPVGALSFSPDIANPAQYEALAPLRRPISNKELSSRIRDRETTPFPVWDGKVRLSVAGYQDKLQVLVEGNQISLADGSLASTHILKPESQNRNTPHMVANEHYCMTLASALGLIVAPVSLRRIPEPILLIERFDRQLVLHNDTQTVMSVRRRHVIDGCQALDLPVSMKYERYLGNGRDVRHIRDGVSYEKLFKLNTFNDPLVAKLAILRWALIQLLLGNSDAHGKNISFYVRGEHLDVAPFYDLVSVRIYGKNIDQELALAFGDTFELDDVGAFDLADFAQRVGIPAALVSREMTRLAKAARTWAPKIAQSPDYSPDERVFIEEIVALVLKQASHFLTIAPQVPKVDPALLA